MIPVDKFVFDQAAFVESVFAFLKENGVSIRELYARTKCSPATLYRARHDPKNNSMRVSTIRKLQAFMDAFWASALD